jgi:outer membrane protein
MASWTTRTRLGRIWTVAAACLMAATLAAAPAPSPDGRGLWTLEAAVAFALENNPDARITRERLAAAEAELAQARAAYLPVLSIGASYGGTDNPGQAFGWILHQRAFEEEIDFNRPGTVDNFNAHGLLRWSLYDGGRRTGTRAAAKAGAEGLEAQAEAVRNDIALGVTRAFLQVRQAEEAIDAVKAQQEALETAVESANAQVSAGALLEAEALHLRVEHARSREDLLRATHAAALARRAFVNLLGLPYREPAFAPGDLARAIPDPPDHTPRRPELDAARKQREAATAAVRIAQASRSPQVHAFARVDHDQGWQTDGSGQSWSAGVAVQYDLWDGGNAASGVRAARARARAAEEEERKVSLTIAHEIESARLGHEEAGLRLEVTRDWSALAEENARLARTRFERGVLLSTQLAEAEAGLTGARVRLAAAENDLAFARAELRRALGLLPVALEP